MNLFSSFVRIIHIVAYCIVFFYFLTIAIYFAVAINNEKIDSLHVFYELI